ncbi:MAG TPA: hypothetical protein PLS10_14280 [Chitinophagales bacterium]|nr:hypothetical protein [Chitinophagales bacterium]
MNKTIITIGAIVVVAFTIFFLARSIKTKNRELTELKAKISEMEMLYSSATFKGDSLHALNIVLSKYKSLTYAMLYRDSIRKSLKYTIGDIVQLKSDSSKAVIQDILIGGGKYEHYMKYQVIRKDHTTELVSPELLY